MQITSLTQENEAKDKELMGTMDQGRGKRFGPQELYKLTLGDPEVDF